MGEISKIYCSKCKNSEDRLFWEVQDLPCYCKSCNSIINVNPVRFTLNLTPCPKCKSKIKRSDLINYNQKKCPWCNNQTLEWDNYMETFPSFETLIPFIGEIIHGFVVYKGIKKDIQHVLIENGGSYKGILVDGYQNFPERTYIEAEILEIGQVSLKLKFIKVLDMNDF